MSLLKLRENHKIKRRTGWCVHVGRDIDFGIPQTDMVGVGEYRGYNDAR